MGRDELLTYLDETVGEDLIGVFEYDEEGTEPLLINESAIDSETDVDAEAIHRENVLTSMEREHAESVYPGGDLYCQTLAVEDLSAFLFYTGPTDGVVIILTPEAHVPFRPFVEACRERIAGA